MQDLRLGQVSIAVKDVLRATAFYKDKLGLELLFSTPEGLAFFRCGSTRLMLSKPETPEFDHPASLFYYQTEGIEARHAGLLAKGVVCRQAPRLVAPMPDHDLWISAYEDGEGNVFALMEEKAK
ncbi:MAG: VOC family protein [candidate division FCPU426 bacterium]